MGAANPKQFLTLGGVSILERTISVFDEHPLIDGLLITLPAPFVEDWNTRFRRSEAKPMRIVAGGPTRQASVFNGLRSIEEDHAMVVIHDGVRPLVSAWAITACLKAAQETGAAVAGRRIKETVKRQRGDLLVTEPREDLWLAHTPQVFRKNLIVRAHEEARRDGFEGTDDACLLERSGTPVRIVEDSATNIKITTPEDLALAEFLLSRKTRPSAGFS